MQALIEKKQMPAGRRLYRLASPLKGFADSFGAGQSKSRSFVPIIAGIRAKRTRTVQAQVAAQARILPLKPDAETAKARLKRGASKAAVKLCKPAEGRLLKLTHP